MARNALISILNKLPENSYFNIISFGSSFEPLYPFSKKKNPETLKKVIESIQEMEADFGGTEIYPAMKYIYEKLKPING